MATQGDLVARARARQRISVEQAAVRAGRDAAEVEAIEAGDIALDERALRDVLLVLGEELTLDAEGRPETSPLVGTHDPAQLAQSLAQSPEWRLEHALAWNRFADEVYLAGRAARGE